MLWSRTGSPPLWGLIQSKQLLTQTVSGVRNNNLLHRLGEVIIVHIRAL